MQSKLQEWIKGDVYKYGRVRGIPSRLWMRSADKRKSFRQWLDNPKGDNRAVFLVGCGRSGTNMVTRHLARSWQVDLYNEGNPAAFHDWRLREFSVIDELIASGYTRIKLFKPILETHLSTIFLSRYPTGKNLFVYRHFNDVINSSISHWGEERWYSRVKTWIEDGFLDLVPALVPEKTKQFICSIWDPSLSPVSVVGMYWIFYNRLYFDLGLHEQDRVMLVNYENLVLNPENSFKDICSFLKLKYYSQFVDGVVSSSMNKGKSPKIDNQIYEECEALWQRLLSYDNSILGIAEDHFHA